MKQTSRMGEAVETTSANRTSVEVTTAANLSKLTLGAGTDGEAILHVYGNPTAGLTPPWMSVELPDSLRRLRIEVAAQTNVGLELAGHTQLTVDVAGEGGTSNVSLAPGGVASIALSAVVAKIRPARGDSPAGRLSVGQLSISSGALVELGSIDTAKVTVTGRATLRSSEAGIETLDVAPGSNLACVIDKGGVVGRLAMLQSGQDVAADRFVLEGSSTLTVSSCINVAVLLEERATLRVNEECAFLDVTGPGKVSLSSADAVIFRTPSVTLDLDSHGQVVAATGTVRLGRVASSHIAGTGGAPGLSPGLKIESVQVSAENLENLSLANATFPVSLSGRRTISALQEHADSVTPMLTGDIPGRGPWRLPYRPPGLVREDLLMQSEFTRALAALAGERGAPASVRTDLAWSAYRMRNASAPGRTERWVLSAYRLIGYGERAIPPLVLYLGVALLLATLSLHGRDIDLSLAGVATYLEAFGSWLMTPLHLLRLTEDPPSAFTLSEPWETFARIALAIPFVTAVLALRNYVKEGHRPKP